MRRTGSALGIMSIIREEISKIVPVLKHNAKETTKSLSAYVDVLKGTDASTPEELAKREEHKRTYEEILAKKYAQATELRNAKIAKMTLRQRAAFVFEEFKALTSKKSGVVALVQHCAAAHAAEVAIEQGIDVKSVNISLEHATSAQGIASESKVVGYIDAPAASEEQVMAFAQKLEKACPAARAMHGRIDWRKLPSDGRSQKGDFRDDEYYETSAGIGRAQSQQQNVFTTDSSKSPGDVPQQRETSQAASTVTDRVEGQTGGPSPSPGEKPAEPQEKPKKKFYWQL